MAVTSSGRDTVTAYQQYGFSSPEELDEACSAAYTAMRESLTEEEVQPAEGVETGGETPGAAPAEE